MNDGGHQRQVVLLDIDYIRSAFGCRNSFVPAGLDLGHTGLVLGQAGLGGVSVGGGSSQAAPGSMAPHFRLGGTW
jgi:hypothetical protein